MTPPTSRRRGSSRRRLVAVAVLVGAVAGVGTASSSSSSFPPRRRYRIIGVSGRANGPAAFAVSPPTAVPRSGDRRASSVAAAPAATERGEYDTDILSNDPRVYVVRNLLSPQECQAYIDRASSLSSQSKSSAGSDTSDGVDDDDEERVLSRSNAPAVSLDPSRLWPLPFLCLGAGVPPVLRLFENSPEGTPDGGGSALSTEAILSAALPPIGIAAVITAALAWGIVQYTRTEANASSRTSEAVSFNAERDVGFIRPLLQRVSSAAVSGGGDDAVAGHSWHSFEAPVVTRYQPGAIFARHNDASPTLGSEWSDLGGQRVITIITYLNDCPVGGGTYFDRLGITVQPKQGSALVFFPADGETLKCDDRTRHESLPTAEGEEKWIVQLFGRKERVPPPLGIPDSFDEEERRR